MTRRSAIYNYAAALAKQCADEFELYLMDYQEKAEAACNGRLVNARGMQRHITGQQLLCGPGHPARRVAYASRELRDHMEHHPLLHRSLFEQLWLAGHLGRRPA